MKQLREICIGAALSVGLLNGCNSGTMNQEEEAMEQFISAAKDAGIPVEIISYQRPDEQILDVWDHLVELNCGNSYSVTIKDKTTADNDFTLTYLPRSSIDAIVYKGVKYNTFTFRGNIVTEDVITKESHSHSQRIFTGYQLGGDPYRHALLADTLRNDQAVRTVLLETYSAHANDFKDCHR